jgi:glucose dehydrogenase
MGSIRQKSYLGFVLVLGAAVACTSVSPRHPQNEEASAVVAAAQNFQPGDGNWSSYAHDKFSTKYTPLTQINRSNVKNLKVLWRWQSPDNAVLANAKAANDALVAAGQPKNQDLFAFFNESTPIAIDGNLYVSTAMSQVSKIDGKTGETVWTYDPKSYEAAVFKGDFPPNNGYVHRGVSYWKSPQGQERIFIGTGDAYLIALDAKTGVPVANFGKNGRIDLLAGMGPGGKKDWPQELRLQYAVTSPLTVCKGVVIAGSSIMDGITKPTGPRGDVRGFDALTGKLKWTFHTIPLKGEPHAKTWKNGSNEYTGNANVWTMTSADEELGLVYLPVSTPTNDWYGGKRPGDGLYGDSLVCLSCAKGQVKWARQLIHHGLWDYDPPAAPNLIDFEKGGKKIKAVVQVTKQAFAYGFNRENGEPIWQMREMPVAPSTVEVDQNGNSLISPTQPMPVKPEAEHKSNAELTREDFVAFDRQGIRQEELIDFSPALNEEAKKIVGRYNYGELYTPPSADKFGTMMLPGWLGGASWAGAAYHPGSGVIYISSITEPWAAKLVKTQPPADQDSALDPIYTSPFPTRFVLDLDAENKPYPYKLPLFKPPYGRVSALDLKTGKVLWYTPLGKGPSDHPKLKDAVANSDWKDKDLGWPRRGHMLLTNDILFVGQSGNFKVAGGTPKGNAVKLVIEENAGEQVLKAFDPRTGNQLVENGIALNVNASGEVLDGHSGNAYGAPMTYLNSEGKQVIVVPVGGANMPAELVGLGL